MNCQSSKELLALYADNSLEGLDKADMEKHLAVCPACAAELAGLKESLELLRTLPEPLPPENLHQHIMEGVRGVRKRHKSNAQAARNIFFKVKYLVAAVFLLFSLGGNALIIARGNLLPQAVSLKGMEFDGAILEESAMDEGAAPVVDNGLVKRNNANDSGETDPADVDSGETDPAVAGSRSSFRARNLLIFNLTLVSLGVLLYLIYRKYFPGEIRD
ncbi:MAG TPA: hypothetical protein GX697_05695 [Firmicutes bacterium]|nr:hypothetical protein [Bacillota bacterium]